jgi:hypothetical protein
MYFPILFVCTGLLVYWAARTALLLYGPPERSERTLESDLWNCRQILAGLRTLLLPPTTPTS